MQRKRRIAREPIEKTIVHHADRPAETLLRRLEDDIERPFEIARLCRLVSSREQDRGVAVVAACMHLPGQAIRIGESSGFLNWQRVHVCADSQTPRTFAYTKLAHDGTRLADAFSYVVAPLAKSLRNETTRFDFFEADLRMSMNATTQFNKFRAALAATSGTILGYDSAFSLV
jgi:hypothetical protein